MTIAVHQAQLEADGLVETRRSPLGLFAAILRNPLTALPPEIFRKSWCWPAWPGARASMSAIPP